MRPQIAALVLGLALGCGEETGTELRARLGDAEAQLVLADRLAQAQGDARDRAGALLYRKRRAGNTPQLALAICSRATHLRSILQMPALGLSPRPEAAR